MRAALVSALAGLMLLAACGSNDRIAGHGGDPDRDHIPTCQEQSDMARSGKVDGGEIAISCPAHNIGDYGH